MTKAKFSRRKLLGELNIHGVLQISSSGDTFVITLWLILFFGSLISCVTCVLIINQEYLKHEVTTKIKVYNDVPALFPKITICNFNSFIHKNATNEFLREVNADILNYNKTIDSKYNIEYIYPYYRMASLSEKAKRKFGYSFDEMILRCSFATQPCDADDFEWFFDYLYGNCFTFNSGTNLNSFIFYFYLTLK